MMKSVLSFAIAICAILLLLGIAPAFAQSFILDADTPATGSLLLSQALVTPYGTVTFVGEIRDRDSDPEFNAAGALGDVFDIFGPSSPESAQLSFDFDVCSISFIYGGNSGNISLEARDAGAAVLDSFFQADTDAGQPAGPVTLNGQGIRSLFWTDTAGGSSFAPIDNVEITACNVSVPTMSEWGMILFSVLAGIASIVLLRKRVMA